jgi:diadenosine tetraphosphate (Ap4A) HIT family hydrolase
MTSCISCRTVAGEILPPGGILFEGIYWSFFLRDKPLLVAGQGFIVLKRHCESMADLTPAEVAELGVLMQRVSVALIKVVGAEKVHFGLYAEDVKHLHLHVTPRTTALPAGNIPLTLLSLWYGLLAKIGIRQGMDDESVKRVAERVKVVLEE